jgi:hypothetical protein
MTSPGKRLFGSHHFPPPWQVEQIPGGFKVASRTRSLRFPTLCRSFSYSRAGGTNGLAVPPTAGENQRPFRANSRHCPSRLAVELRLGRILFVAPEELLKRLHKV